MYFSAFQRFFGFRDGFWFIPTIIIHDSQQATALNSALKHLALLDFGGFRFNAFGAVISGITADLFELNNAI